MTAFYRDGSFAGGNPANGPTRYHTVINVCPAVGQVIVTDSGLRREVTWVSTERTGFSTEPVPCSDCLEDNLDTMACPNDSLQTCVDCCPCHSEEASRQTDAELLADADREDRI